MTSSTDVRPATTGTRRAAVATVAVLLAAGVGVRALGHVAPAFPALLVAVALGAAARTAGLVPDAARAGTAWASTRLLRAGVVLLGAQVAFGDLLGLGPRELVVLVATVAVTFCGTLAVGARLGVPRGVTLLVATGFSICGAAAVAAMSSVATADDDRTGSGARDDVATAVALVTLYGSTALVVLPLAARALGLADRTAGLWVGLSVHEVAQVVAAGAAVSTTALAVAVVAKLGRVVLLAPLVAVAGAVLRPGRAATRRPPAVPLFVAGFLLLVAVRSTGILPAGALSAAHDASTVCLGAAMVALGAQVHVGRLVRGGGRALALGAVATVLVTTTSLAGLLVAGLR